MSPYINPLPSKSNINVDVAEGGMCFPMASGMHLLEALSVAPRNSSVGKREDAFLLNSYGWSLLFFIAYEGSWNAHYLVLVGDKTCDFHLASVLVLTFSQMSLKWDWSIASSFHDNIIYGFAAQHTSLSLITEIYFETL